jgi:preprotein translocase subunit YajC
MLPMAIVFVIFYLIVFRPQKEQRKKLEDTLKALKAGDKVILNPGIFVTVVAVEEDALTVRIDEKTRMRVLKSAVAGLQGPPPDTEKK